MVRVRLKLPSIKKFDNVSQSYGLLLNDYTFGERKIAYYSLSIESNDKSSGKAHIKQTGMNCRLPMTVTWTVFSQDPSVFSTVTL